ncbi:hypothetical protein E2C01_075895 [Portunus trituberculatus]|uniref:Uncharacterized protein n=1 Tax=Portunus trituberculatus TaxID=210409 RepID=A0A5B7IKK3_PORTR|nr:hypothetical protein [Portunus trituberculatus]
MAAAAPGGWVAWKGGSCGGTRLAVPRILLVSFAHKESPEVLEERHHSRCRQSSHCVGYHGLVPTAENTLQNPSIFAV